MRRWSTRSHQLGTMESMYRMFRSNGFNERNVKLFFANGHKQGIEKGASSPYMYM